MTKAPDEDYRIEQYKQMRFMPSEAKQLARARREDGTYLRVDQVERMLTSDELHERRSHRRILDLYGGKREKGD